MKVNIYDFDKTIYDGDSSIDFYIFCIKRQKLLAFTIFRFLIFLILYKFKLKNKKQLKEEYFFFLKYLKNKEKVINDFFENNQKKIKKFYIAKNHSNDIIISASPVFLIEKFAKYLKVKDFIASEVDINTGKFISENCKGINKVKYLYKKYPQISVDEVYSDSLSDIPLMKIANNAYLVKKNHIIKYEPNKNGK